MLELTSNFLDDFENHPIREIESYHHSLKFNTDENILDIKIKDLPPGLFLKGRTISGNLKKLDTWHPVKDYIAESIADKSDDELVFDGLTDKTYENEKSSNLLTMKYFKEHRFDMHYTAWNYFLFGSKAYVMDKKSAIMYPVTIEVTTEHNFYKIAAELPLAPLFSSVHFLTEYGNKHKLVNNENKVLKPSQYIMWRKKQGYKVI